MDFSGPDLIVVGILGLSALLLLMAAVSPKLRKYRFRSPIMRVEPKKRTKAVKKKGKRTLTIRLG